MLLPRLAVSLARRFRGVKRKKTARKRAGYVGRATVAGTTYPAAVSIGTLPTFADGKLQFEAHLIGFTGDLYGQTLQVELIDWIREQWKFPGIDALKKRLGIDIEWTRQRSAMDASQPIASLSSAIV